MKNVQIKNFLTWDIILFSLISIAKQICGVAKQFQYPTPDKVFPPIILLPLPVHALPVDTEQDFYDKMLCRN